MERTGGREPSGGQRSASGSSEETKKNGTQEPIGASRKGGQPNAPESFEKMKETEPGFRDLESISVREMRNKQGREQPVMMILCP